MYLSSRAENRVGVGAEGDDESWKNSNKFNLRKEESWDIALKANKSDKKMNIAVEKERWTIKRSYEI